MMTTNVQLPANVHVEVLTARDIVSGEMLLRTIVWADRVISECPRCRQPIDRVVERCPVMLNPGAGLGGLLDIVSQQHQCGRWLSFPWRPVADGESLADVAREIAWRFDADLADERARIRRELTADLRHALARLAEPLEADETPEERADSVTTGSDVNPGVYRDDAGQWLAWDFDPLTTDGTDCVTVLASDLPAPSTGEE